MNGTEALVAIVGKENTPKNLLGRGGRPTKGQVEGLRRAKIQIERELARATKKVAKTYIALAAGEVIETEKGEIKLQVDPPTTRHFIDRFVPPARPELDLGELALMAVAGNFILDYLTKKGLGTPSEKREIDITPGERKEGG